MNRPHERAALQDKLVLWVETPDVAHAMAYHAWDDHSMRGPNYDEQEWQIARDLNDPAKLAWIMTEELRRRGVTVLGFADTSSFAFVSIAPTIGGDICVEFVHYPHQGSQSRRVMSLSEFRAAILRVLTVPEKTPITEVLQALEVAT